MLLGFGVNPDWESLIHQDGILATLNLRGLMQGSIVLSSMDQKDISRVKQIWLSVSGLEIRCLIAGTSGCPVLLLHGAGLDAAGLSLGSAMLALADPRRVFTPESQKCVEKIVGRK